MQITDSANIIFWHTVSPYLMAVMTEGIKASPKIRSAVSMMFTTKFEFLLRCALFNSITYPSGSVGMPKMTRKQDEKCNEFKSSGYHDKRQDESTELGVNIKTADRTYFAKSGTDIAEA